MCIRDRYFDIGHGCGSFSWDSARKAFEHHFYPDTISTDLHRYCAAEPLSVTLPDVMSKMLCLGMSLEDAVLKTTVTPARALGMEHKLGTLKPGSVADIFVFDFETGDFTFVDTHLKTRKGTRRIVPALVLKQGKVHIPGTVPVRLRQLYASDDDIFRAIG